MNERARRLALWLLALLTTFTLSLRGHGTSPAGAPSVASIRSTSPSMLVKVEGAPNRSGIYELPKGASVETVIIMAVSGFPALMQEEPLLKQPLEEGDVVSLFNLLSQHPGISLKKMPVQEMMLLGIPLDPATMTDADWELLPGIGPALGRRIEKDRQQNGGFRSYRDLERVSGIGPATLEKIRPLFCKPVTSRNHR